MAFNAGAVKGTLELNAKDFISALKRANTALDKIEKNSKQAAKGVSGFRDKLALLRDAVIVVPALFKALSAPIKGFVRALKEASSAAAEFQVVASKLHTSLALQGIANVDAFTEELKEFAAGLQDVTGFSETATLGVAQTLAIMGVTEDQLKLATKATLDYAAATGRDAVGSAQQFAKTLGGTLGELAETFPALKALSKESLMAGGAFQFAADAMGGFAEAIANTTTELRKRFVNAFVDIREEIGGILNPILDEFTKFGIEAFQGIAAALRGNELRKNIQGFLAGVGEKAATLLLGAFDFTLEFPIIAAKAKAMIEQIVFAAQAGIQSIRISFREFGVETQATLLGILEAFHALPLLDLSGPIANVAEEIQRTQEFLAGARESLEDIGVAAEVAADKNALLVDEAIAFVEAMKTGDPVVARIRDGLISVRDTMAQAAAGVLDLGNGLDAVVGKISGAGTTAASAVKKSLAIWKAVNETVVGTALSVDGVAAATDRATSSAQGLADAMGSAAASAAAVGSGDFGANIGAGDMFGRRSGGSVGLDLSNIHSAQAALSAAQSSINRSVGGPFSKLARRSARSVADQIQARLKGMTDAAFADFTSGLISELNRQGILDPTSRQQFIDDRLSEAVRLGVLPSRQGGGGFG